MTIAAAIERRTAQTPARPRVSHVTRIEIITDLSQAEPVWRALESHGLATPYQRFDLLSAWQREVGVRENALPFIVVGHDADGRPLFLLPLTIHRRHGVRIAGFMGGKHANFNMGLWDRDYVRDVATSDLDTILSRLRAEDAADLLALTRQPRHWQDLLNPLAMLPTQRSVNDCPILHMMPGDPPTNWISNSFRRRLKSKERKLQSPGYRFHLATSEADIERLLNWFFHVKPMRMAEQKLPNVFAEPGVEAFVRSACHAAREGGGHAIDIHALECDDEVIAIYAGVAGGQRFSMMFNTYTMSARARQSPGLILLRYIVDHYGKLGYRAFDLGIGSDDYKRQFCKADELIFDSFIPLTSRGRLAAVAMSTVGRAKRLVKHNQALFHLARRLRGTFN
jgi:CelD/BcsL family acetyltransferase involved in cellulose biosynthesis